MKLELVQEADGEITQISELQVGPVSHLLDNEPEHELPKATRHAPEEHVVPDSQNCELEFEHEELARIVQKFEIHIEPIG